MTHPLYIQYFILIGCTWRLFGCMSLGFIARGMDWQGHLLVSRVALLALLADLVWYVFVGFVAAWLLSRSNYDFSSGLLNFCHCCALRLEGMIQVRIIPICVSSEGRMMPYYCIVFSRLPTSACATMYAPCVPCRIAFRIIICPAALCLLMIILFIMGWLQPDSMW